MTAKDNYRVRIQNPSLFRQGADRGAFQKKETAMPLMLAFRRRLSVLLVILIALNPILVEACPLCGAVAPTFTDNLAEAMDAVTASPILGQVAPAQASIAATCKLRVRSVLKGNTAADSVIEVPLVEDLDPQTRYLVFALPKLEEAEKEAIDWAYSVKLDEKGEQYVLGVARQDTLKAERLAYFIPFMEAAEKIISDDAHGELAKASYADLVTMREKFDRKRLVEKLQDDDTSIQHQRLYWMLLGICGRPEDAGLFDIMLEKRSNDPNFELGTDAAIACYISLGGTEALTRIEKQFIHVTDGVPGDATAAVQAIRFHATETTSIPRDEINQVLRNILNRRDLADFIIPDLARMKDWTALEQVFQAFTIDDKSKTLIRVPAVNYLRVCPLPEAKAKLEECRRIDPAAVRRAEILFRFEAE